jgi:DNA-binding LacI/PurR family transcriptional regulator
MASVVTMKDVARAAGVSQPAVSYAYNRPDQISAEVRERILRVAAELNYPGPNPIGRGLRGGTLGAIGLLITDSLPYAFRDPATIEVVRGIAGVGELSDVMLTLLPLRSAAEGEDPTEVEGSQARMALRGLVDGFVVYSLPDHHKAVETALNRQLPTVVIDAPNVPGVSYVGIDDRKSARDAAEHVLGLGHRRVGVLVDRLLPDGHAGLADAKRLRQVRVGVARERLSGYQQAFRSAGLTQKDVPVVETGGFDVAATERALDILLEHQPELTAVVASTDVLALHVLTVLRRRGIAVPEDVSVIGFDDVPAAASRGLTTIAQPHFDKGARSAELLLNTIRTGRHERVILPTSLRERRSTAPPRASAPRSL